MSKATDCINCGMLIFSDEEDTLCGKCEENEQLKKEIEQLKKEIEHLNNELTGYKLSNQSLSNALEKEIKTKY